MTAFPYLALLAAAAAWGGLFHTGKFIVSVIDPFWFTTLRYLLAALFSLPFLLVKRPSSTLPRGRDWTWLTVMGLLGYGFFPILVFLGLRVSVPSHGAVIMATMPITMLVVNTLTSRRCPPAASLLAIVCATVGVCLVAGLWTGTAAPQVSTWKGDLMAWFGTLGWIVYTRGAARLRSLSALHYTAWTTVLSMPGLLVIAALATLTGHAALPTSAQLITITPAMLYTVIAATLGAAWAYNFGIGRLGAAQGIVFVNFIPITATAISILAGTPPSRAELLGSALVIGALLLHARVLATQPADVRTPSLAKQH